MHHRCVAGFGGPTNKSRHRRPKPCCREFKAKFIRRNNADRHTFTEAIQDSRVRKLCCAENGPLVA